MKVRTIIYYRCPQCQSVVEREVGQDVSYDIPRTLRSFCAETGREVTLRRVPKPPSTVAAAQEPK